MTEIEQRLALIAALSDSDQGPMLMRDILSVGVWSSKLTQAHKAEYKAICIDGTDDAERAEYLKALLTW